MKASSRAFKASDYLHPRHWPTWLGLALLRLGMLLPYGGQLAVGRRIGDLIRWLVPRRRHIAQTNIALCFPQLSTAEQKDLLRRSFHSVGITFMETALSWWGSAARLQGLHRIEGIEHLQQVLAQGKGALLLGGHYTTLEISGRLLAFHTEDVQPIYKPARNRLFNAIMENSRQRLFDDLLHNTDFRAIVRSLKHNKVVWYAPDQDFGREKSVFAPFMGIATATLTMTSRLARLSGAAVLPFYSQRLPGNQGFLIKLLPALEDFPSGDDVTDATRINALIEQQVRVAPEQYLWLHRRFKTRPEGEPPLYDRQGRRPGAGQ